MPAPFTSKMRKSGRIHSRPSVCSAIHPRSLPSMRSFPPMRRWRSWLRSAGWMRQPRSSAPRSSVSDWDSPAGCASPSTTSLTACARSWRSSPPSFIGPRSSCATKRSTASTPPAPSKPRRPFAPWRRKAARFSSPVTSPRRSSGSAIARWCSIWVASRESSSATPGAHRTPALLRSNGSSWQWPGRGRAEMTRVGWLLGAGLLLVLGAAPASASVAVDTLLLRGRTAPEVRSLMQRHAETARDTVERGEALYYQGMSFEREGKRDSAIACYQGAVSYRNNDEDRKALMDALLRRRGPNDPAQVLRVLARPARNVIGEPSRDVAEWNGRKAWALYLSGQGDSALRVMHSSEYWLLQPINPMQREWRYRLGVIEEDHGDIR